MQTSLGEMAFPTVIGDAGTPARYDSVAKAWDNTLSRLGFSDAYRTILDEALHNTDLAGVVPTLEVGVGTAEYSAALAEVLSRRNGRRVTVCGVDLSPGMLELADAKLSALGIPFEGLLADGQCLPLPSERFEIVGAVHVIEHSQSPLKMLAEMERVLRPGGTMITMMTRCNPATRSIQKRWNVQCARSQKLEAVLRDFGMINIRVLSYPAGILCNLLSFCCVATKREG